MEYLTLDRIEAYTVSYKLGNEIWNLVEQWESFNRWSIGLQLTKSADSISANIAEGYGRYFKKEKIRFYRYSLGSVYETQNWLAKASDRNIITPEEARSLFREIEQLPQTIHALIKYTHTKLRH